MPLSLLGLALLVPTASASSSRRSDPGTRVAATQTPGSPSALAGEGGDGACIACHEDHVKKFATSKHGLTFANDKQFQGRSCSDCHGSGDVHMAADGAGKILNPAKAPAKESNAACLSCHDSNKVQAHWKGSVHETAGLKCASCHAQHKENALKTGTQLPGPNAITQKCIECHRGQAKSLHQRSAHPLSAGTMDCASCHNPHGSAGEKLIKKDSVNDLCYSCHQEKRGPFLWEHSPVREDCVTCHTPHGSNHPNMLQARITQMCQACHQQGRHQSLPGLPNSVWTTNKQCVNCHVQIHGSNHPSGPLFQR